MRILANPYRNAPQTLDLPQEVPFPSQELGAANVLLARCPEANVTPLAGVVDGVGISRLDIKDERGRMGLGSFKALGAAYVIACDAQKRRLHGTTYATASAGNHGLSVAAGARAFGAKAVIYLSQTVPESFARRLREMGAEVVRSGEDYEASMSNAARDAAQSGWILLSDSSWPGYFDAPWRLMEGYLALMAEVFEQIAAPPTHIFLQAGVGGLAGACAAAARAQWGDAPVITVVEPENAPALIASIEAGRAVASAGPVSNMGRLDCKEPSLIALKGLARDADYFCTLTEAEAEHATSQIATLGYDTSPSGGAGIAALMRAEGGFGLTAASRALCILSEGPA